MRNNNTNTNNDNNTYLPYSTPSEIDLGLCLALFAGSEGRKLFHRIGRKGRIWQPCNYNVL